MRALSSGAKKQKKSLKKMNSDCNLTAGLEAVLQVAVRALVMLRRKIDVSSGLVNGAVGTVIAIKAHHITVQFDGRPQPHDVERVKSRFMLMKKVYVYRKQFPLILAFVVTVHKGAPIQSSSCLQRYNIEPGPERRYNPVSVDLQRQICGNIGLNFNPTPAWNPWERMATACFVHCRMQSRDVKVSTMWYVAR